MPLHILNAWETDDQSNCNWLELLPFYCILETSCDKIAFVVIMVLHPLHYIYEYWIGSNSVFVRFLLSPLFVSSFVLGT